MIHVFCHKEGLSKEKKAELYTVFKSSKKKKEFNYKYHKHDRIIILNDLEELERNIAKHNILLVYYVC
jgi:hypothetical protein